MGSQLTPVLTDFKVADLSLAEWGRKEISIAEHEMPGLMAIRQKYAAEKPLAGRAHHRLAAHDHPDRRADRDPGRTWRYVSAGRAATSSPPRTTPPPPSPPTGVPVFAWKGESLEEYWDCTYRALTHPDGKGPELVVDDGGDVTLLIHKGYELENGCDWVNTPSGIHEEKVIKDLLKKVHAETPQRWHQTSPRTGAASPKRPPPACIASTR